MINELVTVENLAARLVASNLIYNVTSRLLLLVQDSFVSLRDKNEPSQSRKKERNKRDEMNASDARYNQRPSELASELDH